MKVENLILEVNSSKYAYNVSMKELNQLVVKAIMEMPHLRAVEPLTAAQLLPALKKVGKCINIPVIKGTRHYWLLLKRMFSIKLSW